MGATNPDCVFLLKAIHLLFRLKRKTLCSQKEKKRVPSTECWLLCAFPGTQLWEIATGSTLADVERVKCFMHAEVYSSKREGEGKVIPL